MRVQVSDAMGRIVEVRLDVRDLSPQKENFLAACFGLEMSRSKEARLSTGFSANAGGGRSAICAREEIRKTSGDAAAEERQSVYLRALRAH
jgi:hypothetical protein